MDTQNTNNNQVEQQIAVTGQQQTQVESKTQDLSVLTKAIETATSKKESAILKDYFSKQGLDEAGIQQAIADYKAKKAAEQPDPNALASELAQAKEALAKQRLDSQATLIALKLGVGVEQAPYLLKMADLGQLGDNPTEEEITNELNKVLELIPGLKKSETQSQGFQKVGSDSNAGNVQIDQEALKKAFGIK